MRNVSTFKHSDLNDIMAKEQDRRLTLLKEGCKYFNMSTSGRVDFAHMLVNDAHKLLFNFIPKVSCSTWKGVLSKLRSHNNTGFATLGRYSAEEQNARLANYRKVIFVREPMSRILSAYMSKFCALATRNKPDLQLQWERWFGRDIVRRYRDKKVRTFKEGQFLNITLSEFMTYVCDLGSGIRMSQINDHWLPQHVITHPCQIKYDFIGHFENLSVEGPYVLKWLGVDRFVKFPEYHDSNAVKNLVNYYKEVPLGVIQRMSKYYEIDYKLFGYSVDGTASQLTKSLFGSYDE
ncbi:carbohydrate sulfotransferase 14-like [Patiria miniata]|uniref:Carbohydrate sulfotransferase n=1 Tax=Patiria miniata TaxID=46514 RepID=A0A913Z098_PATMI|nr:carbohydrate sulfotransferase 14-like [Patiria miniata]